MDAPEQSQAQELATKQGHRWSLEPGRLAHGLSTERLLFNNHSAQVEAAVVRGGWGKKVNPAEWSLVKGWEIKEPIVG